MFFRHTNTLLCKALFSSTLNVISTRQSTPITCVHQSPVCTNHQCAQRAHCVHQLPVCTNHQCVHQSPVCTNHQCAPINCVHSVHTVYTNHLCAPIISVHSMHSVRINHLCALPPVYQHDSAHQSTVCTVCTAPCVST